VNSHQKWLSVPRPKPDAALRVFCFPFAGGAAHAYFAWTKRLTADVELCLVELPGRGRRIAEEPVPQLNSLVSEITAVLLPLMAEKPFALYGHSMGALILFEVARQLRRSGGPTPIGLLPSAGRAPQFRKADRRRHELPQDEFVKILKLLNGTPPEVFDDDELLNMVIPALRADFSVCDTYEYQSEPPLDCPIIAFGGEGDEAVHKELIAGWSEQTTRRFEQHECSGDHFFIRDPDGEFLEKLDQTLGQLVIDLGAASGAQASR